MDISQSLLVLQAFKGKTPSVKSQPISSYFLHINYQIKGREDTQGEKASKQFLILSAGTYSQTAVQPAKEKWIAGRAKRKISLQKLANYSCLVSNQVPVVNCMYLPHLEILHVCSLVIDLELAYWWKM